MADPYDMADDSGFTPEEQAAFRTQRLRRRNGQSTLPSSSSSSSSSSSRAGNFDLPALEAEEQDASAPAGPPLEPAPSTPPPRRAGGEVRFREDAGQREVPPRAEGSNPPIHNVGAPWLAPPGDQHQIVGGQQGAPTQLAQGTRQYPGASEAQTLSLQTPYGFITVSANSSQSGTGRPHAGSIAGTGLPAAEDATRALGDPVRPIPGISDSTMEDQQRPGGPRTTNTSRRTAFRSGLGNPMGAAPTTDPGPSAAAYFAANPGAGPAPTPTPSFTAPPLGGSAPLPYDVGYRNNLNLNATGQLPVPVTVVPGRPAPLPGAAVGRLLSASVGGLRRATHSRLVSLVAGRSQRQGYTLIQSLADANAPHQRHRILENKRNLLPFSPSSSSANASRRAVRELGEGLGWVVNPDVPVRPTF